MISNADHRLQLAGRALHTVSPLATLDRGYSIVRDATGKVLLHARDVSPGDEILARLSRGELVATVQQVKDDD